MSNLDKNLSLKNWKALFRMQSGQVSNQLFIEQMTRFQNNCPLQGQATNQLFREGMTRFKSKCLMII